MSEAADQGAASAQMVVKSIWTTRADARTRQRAMHDALTAAFEGD